MESSRNTRSVFGDIEIDAPPERVWAALTEAAELVRWFPLEARVEPGEGGSILMSWKNEYAAESAILAWEPYRRLAISWSWDDTGEQPPQVTEYRLERDGERTVVRVVTSGFPDDPSWDAFVEGTERGWRFELRSLKEYLERHAGEERDVVYLRRRTDVSAAEAWQRLFGTDGLGARPFEDPPLDGTVFDDEPHRQYAVVLDGLGGALVRVSVEPTPAGLDTRDVTLWLQAWGEAREPLRAFESTWRSLLERLFPEGETP